MDLLLNSHIYIQKEGQGEGKWGGEAMNLITCNIETKALSARGSRISYRLTDSNSLQSHWLHRTNSRTSLFRCRTSFSTSHSGMSPHQLVLGFWKCKCTVQYRTSWDTNGDSYGYTASNVVGGQRYACLGSGALFWRLVNGSSIRCLPQSSYREAMKLYEIFQVAANTAVTDSNLSLGVR